VSGLILVLLSKTKESCSNDGGLFLVDGGDERQIKKSLSGKRRSSEEIAALVRGFVGS
jgi:hypothetical protein